MILQYERLSTFLWNKTKPSYPCVWDFVMKAIIFVCVKQTGQKKRGKSEDLLVTLFYKSANDDCV